MPTAKVGRREQKKQAFYDALRESLLNLMRAGVHDIKVAAVINNAKYLNGKKVGETTLYGKGKQGEFIHYDFIRELDGLIEDANRRRPKAVIKKEKASISATENVARLRREKAELQAEYDSVLAQLTDLIASSLNSNAKSVPSNALLKSLEMERYILSCLLDKSTSGTIKELSDNIKAYETKYAGDSRLEHANKRVSGLEQQIRHSKVTPIFDTIKK